MAFDFEGRKQDIKDLSKERLIISNKIEMIESNLPKSQINNKRHSVGCFDGDGTFYPPVYPLEKDEALGLADFIYEVLGKKECKKCKVI